jgi:hypothetical protein
VNVGKYASVNSDDGEDDAEQCNCCKFVDKLHSDVNNAACKLLFFAGRRANGGRTEIKVDGFGG